MSLQEDIKIYLPKYLSAESQRELFNALRDFPNNLDERFYTEFLKEERVIFQGDGIKDLIAVDLPNTEIKKIEGIILSNTCDTDPSNKRNFNSQIIYAPIITLKKYETALSEQSKKTSLEINDHIRDIKRQFITQILYLPQFISVIEESIVFLDRIYNIRNDYIPRNNLKALRLFSLSDYGNYLFLLKLSIHFSRIQDKVERKSIQKT